MERGGGALPVPMPSIPHRTTDPPSSLTLANGGVNCNKPPHLSNGRCTTDHGGGDSETKSASIDDLLAGDNLRFMDESTTSSSSSPSTPPHNSLKHSRSEEFRLPDFLNDNMTLSAYADFPGCAPPPVPWSCGSVNSTVMSVGCTLTPTPGTIGTNTINMNGVRISKSVEDCCHKAELTTISIDIEDSTKATSYDPLLTSPPQAVEERLTPSPLTVVLNPPPDEPDISIPDRNSSPAISPVSECSSENSKSPRNPSPESISLSSGEFEAPGMDDEEVVVSGLSGSHMYGATLDLHHLEEPSSEPRCRFGANLDLLQLPEEARTPPDGQDSSDAESIAESIYHQPPKAADADSAKRLALRLFRLEGFRKCDVAKHLSKKNDFSALVGDEYTALFDFSDDTLDSALRTFVDRFNLLGETQEQERILHHFSRRYVTCNPGSYNSADACHTLSCALLLLNKDLHLSGQIKMTCQQFIDNLSQLNDGENFPREVLKALYCAIRDKPILQPEEILPPPGVQQVIPVMGKDTKGILNVSANPFLEVPNPDEQTEYKKGYVMRKWEMEGWGRRTPLGRRGWKMCFAVLRDTCLYLHKDDSGADNGLVAALRLHHGLAQRAMDYVKKQYVFRLMNTEGQMLLLQTSNSAELGAWVDTINYAAALLSAPPLAAGVGSQSGFQRPLMPAQKTKLNMTEQLDSHLQRLREAENELTEVLAAPPKKSDRARAKSEYEERTKYLEQEVQRYKIYVRLLEAKLNQLSQELAAAAAAQQLQLQQQLHQQQVVGSVPHVVLTVPAVRPAPSPPPLPPVPPGILEDPVPQKIPRPHAPLPSSLQRTQSDRFSSYRTALAQSDQQSAAQQQQHPPEYYEML